MRPSLTHTRCPYAAPARAPLQTAFTHKRAHVLVDACVNYALITVALMLEARLASP